MDREYLPGDEVRIFGEEETGIVQGTVHNGYVEVELANGETKNISVTSLERLNR